MLKKLYFDFPAQITPAVHLAVECLGGLDLDNPVPWPVREQVSYSLKAPRDLTLSDVLDINRKVAASFGQTAAEPDDPTDFAQVGYALNVTSNRIAALTGSDRCHLDTTDDFGPNGRPEDLVYALLHWSYDGNNLSNMENH